MRLTLALLAMTWTGKEPRGSVDFSMTIRPTLIVEERGTTVYAQAYHFDSDLEQPTAFNRGVVAEVGPGGVVLGGMLAGRP